jgi:hypothetical protein
MMKETRQAPWIRVLAAAATAAIAAVLVMASLPINAYLAARRYLLQHEIRLRWGSRPRVIVRAEGESWTRVLNERWLPSATERTLVLSQSPDSSKGRRTLPLEWRVYQEWGADFKLVRPPLALIVCKSGRVRCVAFEKAMSELAAGNETLLEEQLAELARLSHRPQ